MAKRFFYIDTCIWLNLFKREIGISAERPFWSIAEEFIEKVIFSDKAEIIYSGLILNELKFKINNENIFREKSNLFKQEEKFRFVDIKKEDYSIARKLESQSDFNLSFYDCLHIAICKRLDLVLVTRDKRLLEFAKKQIVAGKPEDFLV